MANEARPSGEIVVDSRGRTSLARVRTTACDRYLATEHADGTIVLTPAVVISQLELAALQDPAVMGAVTAARTGAAARPGRQDPEAGP
jgi:hypothetical protein